MIRGLAYDRSRDADELLLAAGELAWEEVLLAHYLKSIERVHKRSIAGPFLPTSR